MRFQTDQADAANLWYGPVHFVPGLVASSEPWPLQAGNTLATLVSSIAVCAAAFSCLELHSFTRLFTMIRSVWDRFDLSDLLRFYGTAGGQWRMCSRPEQTYLPGFAP